MGEFMEKLPKRAFGCCIWFIVTMFVLVGIELLRRKIAYALGLE